MVTTGWLHNRAGTWHRVAVQLICAIVMLSSIGTPGANASDASAEDSVRATVTQYLEDRSRSLVTLENTDRGRTVDPTDDTVIAEAFDDIETAIAREVACGWADYAIRTDFADVSVTGNRARVVATVDTDFHYKSSPGIDSGIYNVRYEFRLVCNASGWRIIAVHSNNDDYLRFRMAVVDRAKNGKAMRDAVRELKTERIGDLPRLVQQMRATANEPPAALTTTDAPLEFATTIQPTTAASYSYNGGNGSSYAQRFATVAPGSGRFFYTATGVTGGDCTNFVSQCIWAAYGGYVSGNDTTSKNNIANKVRMVPAASYSDGLGWQGGTGGGVRNWEQVPYLWTYATNTVKARGPLASGYNNNAKYTGISTADVRVGNVFQVRNGSSGDYGHSVYVSALVLGPPAPGETWWDYILVCQHSSDILNRKASNLIAAWGGSNCNMRRLAFGSATFDK